MLNTRLRKQIEWHFYNYKAGQKLYEERVQDIIESNMTVNFSHIGSRSRRGSPTENKAIRIEALDREQSWALAIRNTFLTFRFSPEYDVMAALYIDQKPRRTVIDEFFMSGLWERTFWRWRDKWLDCACEWAQEFKLL